MVDADNKIAFLITSTGWGGLEMNTLKLAKLLLQKGFEITLFTRKNSTIFEKGEHVFSSIAIIDKNRKYFDFKSAKKLSRDLISRSISRLLVVDNKDLDVAAWCKKRYFKELKIVYQQHMQIGINKKDWLHTFRFKSIDIWISPLPFLKREIAIRTNFPLNRVKILPIGVHTDAFKERKYTQEEARGLMHIDSKLPLIGIIGRVSVKKGQLFVIEALQKLKTEGRDYNLLIFGSATVNSAEDQEYNADIQAFVSKNGLEKNVYFIESQPDISKFYNAIDVFVLASQSETYGMVTIEAMLSGLPILATDSGGTTEIVGNGEYGSLYEFENHTDFNTKLTGILEAKPEALEKAKRAQTHAFEVYEVAQEVEGFVEVFKSLEAQ